ncbi:MAG: L-carnitine dehydratase/bile acid-inducible protein [Actinomycetia bacterium]|nr:L-carnitine dehydratase/bile acid-inducible protein [Actinomycetes bacterium]
MLPETAALAGVRIIEFATLVAGPIAGSYLAQLGADVIKVEPIGGDPSRSLVAPTAPDRVAPPYLANNVGKRSVTIDLKQAAGIEAARRLVASADVVIENFRPGALDQLGLIAEEALRSNPGLTWISIRGYGPEGGWRARPAVDGIIQADSGMVEITGHPDGPGVKAGFPVVDHAAGHVIVSTALAALLRRARGTQMGPEQRHHVVALFDVALSMQATGFTDYLVSGVLPRRLGNASQLSAPNQSLRTSDGSVMMAAYLPHHWVALCDVLGCPELTGDPRFRDRLDRMANRQALEAELEQRTTTFTAEELFRLLDGAGLMAGVVRDYEEVATCEQVVANDLLVDVRSSDGRTYRALRSPLRGFDAEDAAHFIDRTGEHTDEILRDVGLDDAEISTLHRAGAV